MNIINFESFYQEGKDVMYVMKDGNLNIKLVKREVPSTSGHRYYPNKETFGKTVEKKLSEMKISSL